MVKSKTWAALLLLLTFLLGGVAGAVSHYLYVRRMPPPGPRGGQRGSPFDITQELARGLDLDAQQKEKLHAIVTQSRERYRALSQQFRPQYDAIRDETRQQIRQILREDQRQRFEDFLKDSGTRHKQRGPR